MKALPLRRWPDYLRTWAEPNQDAMAQSPRRRELAIWGELPNGSGKPTEFVIGRSRDEHGTVLHLTPARYPLADKDAKKESKNLRSWNQWWAKIAVRSGYLSPTVDPVALALLNSLRRRDSRMDFIVDTNVLIAGVGHWLVRCFGDVCDLVRTVVTDLEIQRFGDATKWTPTKFEELEDRTSYLTASRFLECLQEQHPVWRRLDIEEETALFVASSSHSAGKSPGADTLLLRAVRRSLQDQVPGLVRLFVTGDQKLARAASHDLPAGSTIAAYVSPIPVQGAYLSSVHWWPKPGVDAGNGFLSSLADFCYEATCLCDAVRLVKSDGSFLRITSYVRGRNQFPTDWSGPSVWVEDGETSSVGSTGGSAVRTESQATVPQTLPEEVPVQADGASPSSQPESRRVKLAIPTRVSDMEVKIWPLAPASPVVGDPVECLARVSGPVLLDVLAAIMLAARESRSVSERVFVGSAETVRELRSFLRAVDALESTVQPGPAAMSIQEVFASNDTDALSRMLTKASGYHNLIEQLSSSRASSLDKLDVPKRSASAFAGLARLLGQAVDDNGELVYGGAYVSRDDFIEWFMKTVEADNKGPLGGTLLADISRKALYELSMSPARLEKAVQAAMEGTPLSELDFVAGGTPEHILEEEVAALSLRGWTRRKVSADGLLGYRSVRRR